MLHQQLKLQSAGHVSCESPPLAGVTGWQFRMCPLRFFDNRVGLRASQIQWKSSQWSHQLIAAKSGPRWRRRARHQTWRSWTSLLLMYCLRFGVALLKLVWHSLLTKVFPWVLLPMSLWSFISLAKCVKRRLLTWSATIRVAPVFLSFASSLSATIHHYEKARKIPRTKNSMCATFRHYPPLREICTTDFYFKLSGAIRHYQTCDENQETKKHCI